MENRCWYSLLPTVYYLEPLLIVFIFVLHTTIANGFFWAHNKPLLMRLEFGGFYLFHSENQHIYICTQYTYIHIIIHIIKHLYTYKIHNHIQNKTLNRIYNMYNFKTTYVQFLIITIACQKKKDIDHIWESKSSATRSRTSSSCCTPYTPLPITCKFSTLHIFRKTLLLIDNKQIGIYIPPVTSWHRKRYLWCHASPAWRSIRTRIRSVAVGPTIKKLG